MDRIENFYFYTVGIGGMDLRETTSINRLEAAIRHFHREIDKCYRTIAMCEERIKQIKINKRLGG